MQEFSAAIASITAALTGVAMSDAGSPNSSLSGSGVRPSASGRKQVLPTGVSTLNPDSFYHTKVSSEQMFRGYIIWYPSSWISASYIHHIAGASMLNPCSSYHTEVGSACRVCAAA